MLSRKKYKQHEQKKSITLKSTLKPKVVHYQSFAIKKNILIFYQPINSIDFKNEKKVNHFLSANKTINIVSHKFDEEMLKKFNKIISIN